MAKHLQNLGLNLRWLLDNPARVAIAGALHETGMQSVHILLGGCGRHRLPCFCQPEFHKPEVSKRYNAGKDVARFSQLSVIIDVLAKFITIFLMR